MFAGIKLTLTNKSIAAVSNAALAPETAFGVDTRCRGNTSTIIAQTLIDFCPHKNTRTAPRKCNQDLFMSSEVFWQGVLLTNNVLDGQSRSMCKVRLGQQVCDWVSWRIGQLSEVSNLRSSEVDDSSIIQVTHFENLSFGYSLGTVHGRENMKTNSTKRYTIMMNIGIGILRDERRKKREIIYR